MREKNNFIVNIFYHVCGLLFYVNVSPPHPHSPHSPLWNNVQYYLENSYILPLQAEFHIRFKLESGEVI